MVGHRILQRQAYGMKVANILETSIFHENLCCFFLLNRK